MSSTQMTNEHATRVPTVVTVDLKLEVVVIPVSDVDRAKRFYESLGWRLDADFAFDNGAYAPTAPKHHWSEWYAAYIVAREHGRTPEEAANDGALHIESARR